MGTSLTVGPANTLPLMLGPERALAVINREPVGQDIGLTFEEKGNRMFLQGGCDEVVLALAKGLGWLEDLST